LKCFGNTIFMSPTPPLISCGQCGEGDADSSNGNHGGGVGDLEMSFCFW
jgi:hypothetical protein